MDEVLLNYLKSGNACVLIGSGPSTGMGYPSWRKLAEFANNLAKSEGSGYSATKFDNLLRYENYPEVFEEAKSIVGGKRLLQYLDQKLLPNKSVNKVYDYIARWPVPIYLTTNYDNEIQNSLVKIGQSYNTYTNSEDHFGLLNGDLRGAIYKLHGDLSSEERLILTSSSYIDISTSSQWQYWRTKMTSVFQMMEVIIIGHSLVDPHIKHILELAKIGGGISRPICWIAPNVQIDQRKEYLEKFKIRVVSYDNSDGEHRSLIKLIESISDFVPPRESVHISQNVESIITSPLNQSTAASAFFIFNKLSENQDLDEKRYEVILAAIQSKLLELDETKEFDFEVLLNLINWPKDLLQSNLIRELKTKAVDAGLVEEIGGKFKVKQEGRVQAEVNQKSYSHLRDRFLQSIFLRIQRSYSMSITKEAAHEIAQDLVLSLVGFFREGGLSLATIIFREGNSQQGALPISVLRFINEASARYTDYLRRQIFTTIAIDIFARAEEVEREYLGRISQGYFAFNALGIFGDFASEKLKIAKSSLWLIDSNVQISALAIGTSTNSVIKQTFSRLRNIGIRFFSTESIFAETKDHLWFANKVIEKNGASSTQVLDAATGQPPYRKSNLFLEGFVNWQSIGNPPDWESYMFQIFGNVQPNDKDIRKALSDTGIEIVAFPDWPGFEQSNYQDASKYAEAIVKKIKSYLINRDTDAIFDPYKKAKPESEIIVIIEKERSGEYYIISNLGDKTFSWFISDTSLLNSIYGEKITWQPDAFLRFTSTLYPVSSKNNYEDSFQIILLGLAQTGIKMMNEKTINSVFGTAIDQTRINLSVQLSKYEEYVQEKYGETPEKVLQRIPSENSTWASIQFANDVADMESRKRQAAEKGIHTVTEQMKQKELELSKLQHVKRKMKEKEVERLRKKRKNKSKKK